MWPFNKKSTYEKMLSTPEGMMMIKTLLSSPEWQQIGGIPIKNRQEAGSYLTVDDLYSIVRRIVKACKKVPIYGYAVKDAAQYRKYKNMVALSESHQNILEQKERAFELLDESDVLNMRVNSPNDLQTKDEFFEACYTYMLLNGERFIYKEMLTLGANKGMPGALWAINPAAVSVTKTDKYPATISSYQITTPVVKNISVDEMVFTKYFNPEINTIRGLSPLSVAAKLVEQSQSERDYTANSLKNAGAYGAMVLNNPETKRGEFAKAIEALGKMKKDLWEEIGAAWRGNSNVNAKKIGMISGEWSYLNFGISPADMDVINQNKITFKKMCNLYGVSDTLFNNDTASTESNVKEMRKSFYLDCVLPEVSSLVHSLNRCVTMKGKVYEMDISDLPELREDTNMIAQRFAQAPVMRPNDLFEALGWGRIDDPLAEQIFIKQGYTLLEDVGNPFQDASE